METILVWILWGILIFSIAGAIGTLTTFLEAIIYLSEGKEKRKHHFDKEHALAGVGFIFGGLANIGLAIGLGIDWYYGLYFTLVVVAWWTILTGRDEDK